MKKFILTLCCLGAAFLANAQAPDTVVFHRVTFRGYVNSYLTGREIGSPAIYGTWGTNYPFSAGNLMIQAPNGGNDVIIATGNPSTTSLVVRSNSNLGIGDKPDNDNRLDIRLNTGITGMRAISADGHSVRISPSYAKGAYNGIVQRGDQALIYSNGPQKSGAFVIAPNDTLYTSGLRMDSVGNVAIGTATTSEKLAVKGTIVAVKVKVSPTGWADFVFDPAYKLPSLQETEAYIQTHQHLPDVPSATEVAKNGQDLGEMNKILLQKLEEMTLHMIRLQKEVDELKARK